MFKKILIGSLILVAVAAVGTSLYNTILLPSMQAQAAPAAGQGYGNAWQATPEVPVQQQVQQADPVQPQAASPDAAPAAAGQGNGNRFGAQNQVQATVNEPVPQPQNGLTEWLTYTGTVTDLEAPFFNLLLADGQVIPSELGSLSYLSQLGLSVQNGDSVTVTGFWDANGALTLGQITLADGQTYILRDELGRPSWRGGPGRGGQGGNGAGNAAAAP